MYVPNSFRESDVTRLHDLIERYSFGVLVSQVDGAPFATHLPFLVDRDSGPNGTLIGHTARANPQCQSSCGQSVLAIFSGPHSYISPTWYEAENVVPTWNYVSVQARGVLEIVEDKAELATIVTNMTNFYEKTMPGSWKFETDSAFADRLLPQIVGFRIQIDVIEGKWKLSQNQPAERQAKVAAALLSNGSENSLATANFMLERLHQH